MAVPSSGELRLRGDIALEVYGDATGNNISLGTMSDLAGFSEPDGMGEFYGYSAADPPSVVTNNVTSVTGASMTLNGNVTSDGGATVTERGFYFGTNVSSPTNNPKYVVGGTTGAYSLARTGLNSSTTYYVWAYATNSEGTTFGGIVSQATNAPFTPAYISNLDTSRSRGGTFNLPGYNDTITFNYLNPDTSSYVQYSQYQKTTGASENFSNSRWTTTGQYWQLVSNTRNLRYDLTTFTSTNSRGPNNGWNENITEINIFPPYLREWSFSGGSINMTPGYNSFYTVYQANNSVQIFTMLSNVTQSYSPASQMYSYNYFKIY